MRLNLAVSALAAACSASSGAGPFAVVVGASDVPTPMTKTKKAAGNDGQPVGLRYANNDAASRDRLLADLLLLLHKQQQQQQQQQRKEAKAKAAADHGDHEQQQQQQQQQQMLMLMRRAADSTLQAAGGIGTDGDAVLLRQTAPPSSSSSSSSSTTAGLAAESRSPGGAKAIADPADLPAAVRPTGTAASTASSTGTTADPGPAAVGVHRAVPPHSTTSKKDASTTAADASNIAGPDAAYVQVNEGWLDDGDDILHLQLGLQLGLEPLEQSPADQTPAEQREPEVKSGDGDGDESGGDWGDVGFLPPHADSVAADSAEENDHRELSSHCPADGTWVDCVNGKVRNTNTPCATACNGKCCIGANACDETTACIKKDKSCNGDSACRYAGSGSSYDLQISGPSCDGNEACFRIFDDNTQNTGVKSVTKSCLCDYACFQYYFDTEFHCDGANPAPLLGLPACGSNIVEAPGRIGSVCSNFCPTDGTWVDCLDGKLRSDSSTPCNHATHPDACGTNCCVGTDACRVTTACIKKDGSCNGDYACGFAGTGAYFAGTGAYYHINYALQISGPSCTAKNACYGMFYDNPNTGPANTGGVVSLTDSCLCEESCYASDPNRHYHCGRNSYYPTPSHLPGLPMCGMSFNDVVGRTGYDGCRDPSSAPSSVPSSTPSRPPSESPSTIPSNGPSNVPSSTPSADPTISRPPSEAPSTGPSLLPSFEPSSDPSALPSAVPSSLPSVSPSAVPSSAPSIVPSSTPSAVTTKVSINLVASFTNTNSRRLRQLSDAAICVSLGPIFESTLQAGFVMMYSNFQRTSLTAETSGTQECRFRGEAVFLSNATGSIPSEQSLADTTAMVATPERILAAIADSNSGSLQNLSISGIQVIDPSEAPSSLPSSVPSQIPSKVPSNIPSGSPSVLPSDIPSDDPSSTPSIYPTTSHSPSISQSPSAKPTPRPRPRPVTPPRRPPTAHPSSRPSSYPSSKPSVEPTSVKNSPSLAPSASPTSLHFPSASPSVSLPASPSTMPSVLPSPTIASPSPNPSTVPTTDPSAEPSAEPSLAPSSSPTVACRDFEDFDDSGYNVYEFGEAQIVFSGSSPPENVEGSTCKALANQQKDLQIVSCCVTTDQRRLQAENATTIFTVGITSASIVSIGECPNACANALADAIYSDLFGELTGGTVIDFEEVGVKSSKSGSSGGSMKSSKSGTSRGSMKSSKSGSSF